MSNMYIDSLLTTMEAHQGVVCINEERGYVAGNVLVVARWMADLINHCRKVPASPDELRLVAEYIEAYGIC